MKILRICCGIAVLLTTLAFAHMLHHLSTHAARGDFSNPTLIVGFVLGLVVGILSLIGGYLLLKGSR
jgi:F0F1-type ATP synthase membrane subunit c/vacuolar-type H+-ATPase subunit K